MEGTRSKKTADLNPERRGVMNKKKYANEKKTKSDTTTNISGVSLEDTSIESIMVVGKGCSFAKSKSHESGHQLHECHSETELYKPTDNKTLKEVVLCEGAQQISSTFSNTSFISAKSNLSHCEALQKRVQDLEDKFTLQFKTSPDMKTDEEHETELSTEVAETDTRLVKIDEHEWKLREIERKLSSKEKKIKDLNQKLQECNKAKDLQAEEKKNLVHQVHVLNRQLQSMYELVGKKNWSNSFDATELIKYKQRTTELEAMLSVHESDKKELQKKIEKSALALEKKEKELNLKAKEFIEYKNKSTLELCKLINQIDCLQNEAKNQSHLLDTKIMEAQSSMEDEVVSITQKLEDQYQKDVQSAIDKLKLDFERVANLPKSAIEKLLKLCESNQIDLVTFQKEWDKQQTALESKITSMKSDHNKELLELKESYENKISFFKVQIDTLVSQLKERKEILDVFEKELMIYKNDSSLNLLRVSSRGNDISTLKEMYKAEVVSQKQIYMLQLRLFEEKVKTLTEEILYHAKNEETHMLELKNARKMAYSFREKYEQIVVSWEEKLKKESKTTANESFDRIEFDSMFEEFKNLIESLKKSEEAYEEKLIQAQTTHNDDTCSYVREVETFKKKLSQLESFQKAQSKLDETIQELIKALGGNYTKTIETLLDSHATEMNLKQAEFCSIEKLHSEELNFLKNSHEKEITELRNKIKDLENSKLIVLQELDTLKKNADNEEVKILKEKLEDLSVELLKKEGLFAIKEETERTLNDRIQELEGLMKDKEENCRKELEDLVAKLLQVKVMSAAKDDLAKELEDKLNRSEDLVEKSSQDVEQLFQLCCLLDKNTQRMENCGLGDCGYNEGNNEPRSKFSIIKSNGEQLQFQISKAMEKLENLDEKVDLKHNKVKPDEEELICVLEKNKILTEERNNILDENEKLRMENNNLLEALDEKDKIILSVNEENERCSKEKDTNTKKLEELEEEKNQILLSKEMVTVQRNEILERNGVLEKNVQDLNERVNDLMTELANKESAGEVFSFSLQEVRFLYQEEHESEAEAEKIPSTSTISCQVDFLYEDLCRENQRLTKENEWLKKELRIKTSEAESEEDSQSAVSLDAETSSMLRNVQSELFAVMRERDKLIIVIENLEKENKFLKEELMNLKEEKCNLQKCCEVQTRATSENTCCGVDEDSVLVSEMKGEIRKLSDYIKTLSSKLDLMKANNESLLNESHEHLKQNQNLVNELEEAWSQRYELEDQLSKVRKENAVLNLHRAQLEETNRRISNLVAEGQPSVVSWIKIHETVENIIDEVLALKTSFSDSGSISGASTGFDVPKTASELKLMAETLHVQLQNKTVLCDELLIQKDALERELKRLEQFLKQNDTRLLNRRSFIGEAARDFSVKKKQLEAHNMHSIYPKEKRLAIDFGGGTSSENTQLMTLNMLKKRFEDQVELKEAQFRESLQIEIKGLKREMLKPEESLEVCLQSPEKGLENEESNFDLTELRYEEEVSELTKEFEREVEKLREIFAQETNGKSKETMTDEVRARYLGEIEKLKKYFETKWIDLEKRYQEIYKVQDKDNLSSSSEHCQIINDFLKILLEEKENETAQRTKAQIFLKEILKKHSSELNLVQAKYKETLNEIENSHIDEIQTLKSVVSQLKENILKALKREEEEKNLEEAKKEREDVLQNLRQEYEKKLELEKQNAVDLLEAERLKHDKELTDLEEFWTEKLSECETKCAILKATEEERMRGKAQISEERDNRNHSNLQIQQYAPENIFEGQKEKKVKELQRLKPNLRAQLNEFRLNKEILSKESFCSSCQTNQSYFEGMEMKTDDDKLEIVRERDALKEAVTSLRYIVAKLLNFIGQHRIELNNTFDNEETMYKSIQFDMDNTADCSVASSTVILALDLSTIIQEINENSFLNSSDQVRVELDRCLKQLKKEATNLLALSHPENAGPNLRELIKKIESEKDNLEMKVKKVEEMQEEIKKEFSLTKDRLSQWERNLEVVSEGYGEEIVEPKKTVTLSDFKDKIKLFLTDQPQEINLLDEICKEGDRLLEEWKREKFDLQQQIEVADKQLHSFKKFIEEQAAEREQEREAFDKEINCLKESLKAKERDNLLQNRTNREGGLHVTMTMTDKSVEALEAQLKELTNRLSDCERDKSALEVEFQNAVKKIWSLREVIQELEVQLAEVSEKELNLRKKNDKLDALFEEQAKINRDLKEELEICKNQNETKYSNHIKNLEEELSGLQRYVDQIGSDALTQLKSSLREIERILIRKTKDLEQLHVSSANVSCSSPSEEVSLRDQFDVTRCSTPEEMASHIPPEKLILPLEEVDRVHEKLAKHNRAEEAAMKCIKDLKMRMRSDRKAFEEIQTERDILLEKVDTYLKENSSLKVRLEEQRCNAGLLQKQLNASLESQINRLEMEMEKLDKLCLEKDKQLKDMTEILENTTKTLKMRETEVLNKSKEENTLIATLKTDLGNALNQNQHLEEKVKKMKEKLKENTQIPALIDSMIDEKNAEIDRLEKEVTRLSSELSSLSNSKSMEAKNSKRIKFSEPDSFGECISSISAQNPSIIRYCSDSYSELKHSPFRIRQPFQSSTKIESVSSIGPLQLSPRGTDSSLIWKTSSPILSDIRNQSKSPPKKTEDLEKIETESKLQCEIETKQREILELHLEIDILKRQLVEINQELTAARSQYKEAQNDIITREEDIKKLQNSEKSLMMSIETLKKNHSEEVEELQNKLCFEHSKVEKVYGEIKILEMKKVEIEEAFLNLKEEYNEKLNGEQKASEALISEVKDLEEKNGKLIAGKEKLEKEFYESCQKLGQEILDLKEENEKLKISYLNSTRKSCADAEIQVEEKGCDVCKKTLQLEATEVKTKVFKENIEKLRKEFEKMSAVLSEKDFGKKEAFSYAMVVRRILSSILNNVDDLHKELEGHKKKVMECSVDDLAVKVQKELVLSAKLDYELLSSIEANNLAQKTQPLPPVKLRGGGGDLTVPQEKFNAVEVYTELMTKISNHEIEKDDLRNKISQLEKTISQLEDRLAIEEELIKKEKERCEEDAKLMELLRVNLEKSLQDLKSKEEELKKEKQMRMSLEKEVKGFKKYKDLPESKRLSDLKRQVEIHKEKLVSLNLHLEEEKKKSQELSLSLERNRIERMSEKSAQKLLESDLALVRDQKENLKVELFNARKILNSRNVEIGLLKRKINLQEIDIKALSLSSDFHRQTDSDTSSLVNKFESLDDISLNSFQRQSMPPNTRIPTSLVSKMKKLSKCVQLHLEESAEMEEAFLNLSYEREQMRDVIQKLEENETKSSDKTLVPDFELDKRLWALEKGALVMEIENLKREQEILKENLIEIYKINEILKMKSTNSKSSPIQENSNQIENGFFQDRIYYLTMKCMRAESYRKALAWQKHYLMVSCGCSRRSEEEVSKRLGRKSGRRRKAQRSGRFKMVVLAVIAIFRMKHIVKRWRRTPSVNFCASSHSQTENLKRSPLASVLNIYNEPVNPLSYQTQNIIRPSKVLRTPPNRDTGLFAAP